ncbi:MULTISPECIES: MFS transporter [Blautia]|uniref:MFS transporter n=1 Tax=Blautia TaxID=572511 RepID=UPI000BA334F6|nr:MULTISPECIES: MFS transporter [Blautia]
MVITGKKRWFVLVIVSLMAGVMVYVPFLRYSYYDQMVMLFSEYKPVASAANVNEFIGDFSFWFGLVCTIGYPIGGILVDKFGEKWLLIIGSVMMGACSFWFGLVPDKLSIIIIHVLYGVGTSFFIWNAYLKTTRKMGNASEQGSMFSTSEFVRAIMGMLLGFLGVALLNRAIMPGNATDLQVLGAQWRNMLFFNGALFLVLAVIVFFVVPNNIIGAEDAELAASGKTASIQEKLTAASVLKVLKMPGTWLLSLLIFFCFSFTSAANGYLGSYTVNVLGISQTQASTFAVVRNYIIAGLATLAIGFIADKIGSKVKTLGYYLAIATVLTVAVLLTKNAAFLCIGVTFVFAVVYTGMRGIYFATLGEVGIPLSLTGVATGVISLICYLPDVYFAKLAGIWLDKYGKFGYDLIWYWVIGCGILGILVAFISVRYSKKLKAEGKVQ